MPRPARPLRICLFDWTSGGHHSIYVRRCIDALSDHHDVIAAVPDELAAELSASGTSTFGLGSARPREDVTQPLGPQHERLAAEELDRLEEAVASLEPDHVLHLYGDPIIRRLVRRKALPTRVSLLIFFPRSHYPGIGSPLSHSERARAVFLDALVRRWAWRRDAHAILTLDPLAARRWRRRLRVPAGWFPEPPVLTTAILPTSRSERSIIYGVMSRNKGLELVVDAFEDGSGDTSLTIAGTPVAEYVEPFNGLIERLRRAAVDVQLELRPHTEEQGLQALGAARSVLLPYPRHVGMSRVLLESCAVGTPVVAHDFGLLGYLVRTHGLGRAVDCHDASALRRAVAEVHSEFDAYQESLARWASDFGVNQFRRRLLAVFDRS